MRYGFGSGGKDNNDETDQLCIFYSIKKGLHKHIF